LRPAALALTILHMVQGRCGHRPLRARRKIAKKNDDTPQRKTVGADAPGGPYFTLHRSTAVGNAFMHSARSARGTDESVPYENFTVGRGPIPPKKRPKQNRMPRSAASCFLTFQAITRRRADPPCGRSRPWRAAPAGGRRSFSPSAASGRSDRAAGSADPAF